MVICVERKNTFEIGLIKYMKINKDYSLLQNIKPIVYLKNLTILIFVYIQPSGSTPNPSAFILPKKERKENRMEQKNKTITFEIVSQLGVLSENSTGWKRELNLISWNGEEPKYDIRDWNPSHERMSRGITLSKAEMNNLLLHMREERLQQRSGSRQPVHRGHDYER